MNKTICCGHVLDVLKQFPDNSIDVVVTSPPYWGLRDYGETTNIVWNKNIDCEHEWGKEIISKSYGNVGTKAKVGNQKIDIMKGTEYKGNYCIKCGAWQGQLGLEPHPQMYINHIVEIMREIKRVLKNSGSLWLNIGDTYYGPKGGGPSKFEREQENKTWKDKSKRYLTNPTKGVIYDNKWLQPKQQLMIPERIAIAMQEDGWVKRNTVIWYKPNHMPSSVRDRLSVSYESMFFFVKSRKYYFDLDGIREPHKYKDTGKRKKHNSKYYSNEIKSKLLRHEGISINPLGKNPGDMWNINTEPQSLYWCNHCNKFVDMKDMKCIICNSKVESHFATFPTKLVERILKCSMPKDGIVLDPFMGSGTTGLVAKELGYNWIGIELNPIYCRMAIERIGEGTIIDCKTERIKIEKQEDTISGTDYQGKYSVNPETYGSPRAREARIKQDLICPLCKSKLYKGKRGIYCSSVKCSYYE